MLDAKILSMPSSQLINRIKFKKFNNHEFINIDAKQNHWHLSGIRQINLFTGENNSRKSRLLRAIFNTDIEEFESESFTLEDISEKIISVLNSRPSLCNVPAKYRSDFESSLPEAINSRSFSYKFSINDIVNLVEKLIINKYSRNVNKTILAQEIRPILENLISESNSFGDIGTRSKPFIYIPLLRGLRPLDTTSPQNDLYAERTIKDYFTENRYNDIFTGISLYQELTEHLLGSHDKREIIRKYESYLSSTFFENKDLALVPRLNEDVVYLKIGDYERPIFHLGDGIQSLIILTFKVFTATEPTVFFIEEPEQHLHPGMQRVLIDALSRFDKHMYFMTTHSNHLIDIAQEQNNIAVHRVANNADNTSSEITPLTYYSDALADLGVRASSVLLANCSIWVEGVTDKLYLRVYLEKFLTTLENSSSEKEQARAKKLRQYKENLHYVFTEYQGSNITHWDFGDSANSTDSSTPAKKLNNKIFLLADGDIAGKGERVKELNEKLGDKFFQLKSKEIENQIPFDILVKTAETRWKNFNETAGLVFNSENLKTKPKDFFDVEDSGIGIMLERYIHPENNSSEKGKTKDFFKAKSGTIKDKVKFCNTAIEIMQNNSSNWTLTPKLIELCNAIWAHIEESN